MLGRDDYLDAARETAEFVWTRMRDADGRLLRTYKDGEARLNAYLEDHAFLLEALLTLYESSFDVRWFDAARETADTMIERFADPERGGFFTTSTDDEQLVARRKDVDDHPIPSGNSAAAFGLLRLAALTGERRYAEPPSRSSACSATSRSSHPQAVAAPAARGRLQHLAGQGGRAGERRGGRRRARATSPRRCARACDRTSCSPAAPRAPSARS